MKIPLVVEEHESELKLYVYFFITGTHFSGRIKAIVDTGSSETIISEGDVMKLNVPLSREPTKIIYGVSGNPMPLYSINNAKLFFRGEGGNSIKMKSPLIYGTTSAKKDKEIRRITQSAPSILGTKFLRDKKLRLVFDPYKKTAHLEESC